MHALENKHKIVQHTLCTGLTSVLGSLVIWGLDTSFLSDRSLQKK